MFNVLFAANDKFSPYLGVSIYSLLKNNCEDFDEINIYVLDDDINMEHKNKLRDIVSSFNQKLIFITVVDIESMIGNKLHLMEKEGVSSSTAYARLFASTLLPDIDKILYLDSDSLIVNSFKELWELNITNYYVAGVEDMLGVDYIKNQINLNESNIYINSGFLLMNLKKWREDNIEEQFIKFLKNHLDKFIFHDQGVVNGVCKDKILCLDPKYNLQGQFHGIDYNKAIKWAGFPNHYDEKTIINAQKNPIFIHFTGKINRPWSNKKQHFYKLYYKYVNETPFKNEISYNSIPFRYIAVYSLYKSKFVSLILRFVPMNLTIKLANNRIKSICENELK